MQKSGRVVVTGLGLVSCLGTGKDKFWEGLTRGVSGIGEITLFDTSQFKRHYGGQINDFNPSEFIPSDLVRFIPRASQFALAATKLALKDAKSSARKIKNKKVGVIIGTTMAEGRVYDRASLMFVKEQWDEISLNFILNTFSSSIPRNLGYLLKIKGINLSTPNACAAGNYALGYGFDLLKRGEIDLAIVGGAETLSRVAFQGFQRLYAMANQTCSPFDKDREGMLLGEGAGILILEPLENALERGAPVYAEVLGYGISSDAHHITIPKKEGIEKAMEKALKNSGISYRDVDYISAHGTGTKANDTNESGAIKKVFKERYKKIPVSSIKSMLGHSMGAASSLESIACCLALNNGEVPPTINFKTPDPECDIDCVPNKARKAEINVVLNNAFAFGGNNCCVVFSKRK